MFIGSSGTKNWNQTKNGIRIKYNRSCSAKYNMFLQMHRNKKQMRLVFKTLMLSCLNGPKSHFTLQLPRNSASTLIRLIPPYQQISVLLVHLQLMKERATGYQWFGPPVFLTLINNLSSSVVKISKFVDDITLKYQHQQIKEMILGLGSNKLLLVLAISNNNTEEIKSLKLLEIIVNLNLKRNDHVTTMYNKASWKQWYSR